ncbi:hypothetical protein [Embleya sp. NPDC020630]|uniref:hypothetical protein n=1 Tax=Embleya sp. NPDC020630 TaxID=3363979 RepID=UPI00378D386B
MRYVDLDSTAPVVTTGDAKSRDFTVTTTGAAPSLSSRSDILAPLPASGPTPTEAQCAKAVADSGTHHVEAAKGSRLCLTTTEGGTAYLNVLSAPSGRGIAKLTVTVWGTSAA